MKTNKRIIDTYTTLYQIDIVVANKYTTLEELQKLYMFTDKVELNNSIIDDCIATTSIVTRKKDNKTCILVKYNQDSKVSSIDKKLDFINTCSHEATHVALDIYEIIQQQLCFCSPEPFCYLQAYATECIYKTLTRKK